MAAVARICCDVSLAGERRDGHAETGAQGFDADAPHHIGCRGSDLRMRVSRTTPATATPALAGDPGVELRSWAPRLNLIVCALCWSRRGTRSISERRHGR